MIVLNLCKIRDHQRNIQAGCMWENTCRAYQKHQPVMLEVSAEKKATRRQLLPLSYLHVKDFLAL